MKDSKFIKINKKRNLGIQFLRFILCLWIVIIHCSRIKRNHHLYFFRGFHVPTFILLSFYFFYNTLSNRNIDKIIDRFKRLLIPYIIWPILIYILNNFFIYTISFGQFKSIIPIKSLFSQFIYGSSVHGIFWFQFNLIFLSLLFTIFSFMFKRNFLIIIYFLGLLCIYLQISEINYYFFVSFKHKFIINIASLIELLPLATVGCFLCKSKIADSIYKLPFHYYFSLLFYIICLFRYKIFRGLKGFRYPNIVINIFASVIFLFIFVNISFDKFKYIDRFISNITQFTGGIYYLHPIIRDYFKGTNFFLAKSRNYYYSFLIYLICYTLCFIGIRFFKNNNFKYMFV